MKRAFVWMICHNLCLCGVERWTMPVTRGHLSRACGRLDRWAFDD